jgi:hypothetical protein
MNMSSELLAKLHATINRTRRLHLSWVRTRLARDLDFPSFNHLLLALLDEPIAFSRFASWNPCPQNLDPGFMQAIRSRDERLRVDLERLAAVWPPDYIAAHYRVSPHWVRVAMLAFRIVQFLSHHAPQSVPAGEAAWLDLPPYKRREVALVALAKFDGVKRRAAISLGVTPCAFVKEGRAIGIFTQKYQATPRCYEDTTSKAGQAAKVRQTRARLKEADLKELVGQLDKYENVRAYCQATGRSYQKTLAAAHKAGYIGIRPYESTKVKAEKVLARLASDPQAKDQGSYWWARNVLSIDVETITQYDLRVAKQALKAAGMVPVRLGVGRWIWR